MDNELGGGGGEVRACVRACMYHGGFRTWTVPTHGAFVIED